MMPEQGHQGPSVPCWGPWGVGSQSVVACWFGIMNGVDRGRGGIGGTCVVTPGNVKLKVTPYNKLEFIPI